MPEGTNWKSSLDGVVYAYNEIPNNVAATYMLTTELVDASPASGAQAPDAQTPSGATPAPGAPASTSTCSVTSVTVNVKTVSSASLVKAAKKAGADVSKVNQITLGPKVRAIKKNVFKKCGRLKTLVIKTKKLTKKSVKGCLKGSKVKIVKIAVGSISSNKKYTKKYRKLFIKTLVGKKVQVAAAH